MSLHHHEMHLKLEKRDALIKKKQERMCRVAELEQSIASIHKRISDKEERELRESSTRAQLMETMSQLKCRALNFDETTL